MSRSRPRSTTRLAQQLITSAWNVIFAVVLVVWVFGWTGGKELVGGAYTQAKEKAAEMKEQRKHKKPAGDDAPEPEPAE